MPEGYTRGLLHGIYGREGQALLTHVLLDTGANWSGIPLHLLRTEDWVGPQVDQAILQPWGCMGRDLKISELEYLGGLSVELRFGPQKGRHTGIIIDWDDAFAKHPQEHKPLSLLIVDGGHFALLPNNYFILTDKHFTTGKREMTKNYYRGSQIYWEP
jgi:hypothetical protein